MRSTVKFLLTWKDINHTNDYQGMDKMIIDIEINNHVTLKTETDFYTMQKMEKLI